MNNPALLYEVKKLVCEVEKTHRYSMSRIYGLYNEVFGTNETPQSCASCLIRKVRELKAWFSEEAGNETPAAQEATPRHTEAAKAAPAKTNKKCTKKDK
jgi:hypothetical protein